MCCNECDCGYNCFGGLDTSQNCKGAPRFIRSNHLQCRNKSMSQWCSTEDTGQLPIGVTSFCPYLLFPNLRCGYLEETPLRFSSLVPVLNPGIENQFCISPRNPEVRPQESLGQGHCAVHLLCLQEVAYSIPGISCLNLLGTRRQEQYASV